MKTLLFFVLMLLCANGYCSIREISNFEESRPYLQNLDEDTLVLFDVDGVIFQPAAPFLHPKNFQKYRPSILALEQTLSIEERDYVIGLMASGSENQLIDKKIPQIIKQMQARNAKVIAFTAIPSGKIANIENMTTWRHKCLHENDIDFHFEDECIVFNEFPKNLNSYPTYFKGLLVANGMGVAGKGDVLISFLDKMNYTPKKVIFFDDHLYNLESVEEALSKLFPKVDFVGFHYHGAYLMPWKEYSEEEVLEKVKELILIAKQECSFTL